MDEQTWQDTILDVKTQLISLYEKMKSVTTSLSKIEKKLDGDYVTKAEYVPVRNLVYGFVSLVLIGVVTALLALVVR